MRRDDRGAVLVITALWLPVLLIMMTFSIDTANWFLHKRHLQMQADAGALAAAQEFRYPCVDSAITQKADQYSGALYNAQIGGSTAGTVHRLINSKTYYNQTTPNDDTATGGPCAAGMIDVKLTETGVPLFFRAVGNLLGTVPSSVPYINAQARIAIRQATTRAGALPVAVPDVNPQSARAYFIDENTGAALGSAPLTKVSTSNGLVVWDNATAPAAIKFDTANVNVGVIIALSGTTNTTCGATMVDCFDSGATNRGVAFIRGYSNAGSGLQSGGNKPILRSVSLLPGSCADPYFSAATSSCTFGVRANVDFGTVGTADQTTVVGGKINATVNGTTYALTYDATNKVWNSPTTIPLAASAGPVNVSMDWAETSGTLNGDNCTTNNSNKCKGDFGTVHRAFGATATRSGPLQAVTIEENGVQWANSVERCSSVQTNCTHNLVVRIGVAGNLGVASSVSDPVVSLRVIGGSQNQSLDCDPAKSTLKDELATGCGPKYTINTGTACPASPSALWGTAQPWSCVGLQTGSATNQVPAGMNTRILGTDKPSTCTSPNNWSSFPNFSRTDKRILQVFLTPYGAFTGSGTTTVPVIGFATFYVTGWTGSGQGFNNPCQGNGDDPVPNNDAGYIVGHFIKYVDTLSTDTGSSPCDLNALGSCVAVMTR